MEMTTLLTDYSANAFMKAKTREQYDISVRLFESWIGRPATVDDLTRQNVVAWLHWLNATRSPRTVNGKRQMILTLWRHAARLDLSGPVPDIPKVPEAKRIPSAWSVEQMTKILQACDRAKPVGDWSSLHWRSLVLAIYDTSTRIGAILQVKRSDLSGDVLIVRAEYQKQNSDTFHRLSDQTLQAIDAIPKSGPLIWDWPKTKRRIWIDFKRILEDADLPHSRRDLFHKIRRTSYTQVALKCGFNEASRHAGHSTDLSRFYFDPTQGDDRSVIDSLPRS